MDLFLFQFTTPGHLNSPKRFGMCHARAGTHFVQQNSHRSFLRIGRANPCKSSRAIGSPNVFCKSFSIVRACLGLAFFLIVTQALAQSFPSRTNPASQPETSVEINQRLRQTQERLAVSATEPLTSEYRIGPDDLLNITVFEAPEMNCTTRVSASGEISLQLLGPVHAAGLAPTELETVLQGLLRRTYMKDPHVGVFIQELQSHPVSVVGAVKMPGVFQIRGTKTVIEVLSMAQGLADDAGDTVLIMRGAGYAESGSFSSLLTTPAENPSIQPARETFARSDGSNLTAAENKSEIDTINLKKLLESDDSALNVQVRPGDIVKVPRAGIVYVVGEVQKPGGFVLQNNENISVLQALALAEGPTHTSAMGRTRVIRTDPATGKRSEIPMNLAKIVSGKAPDAFLQPKDIVFVPNSTTKSVLYRGSEAALQTAAGVAIYKW
jgi:polysaccharide export outer membrane protein